MLTGRRGLLVRRYLETDQGIAGQVLDRVLAGRWDAGVGRPAPLTTAVLAIRVRAAGAAVPLHWFPKKPL